MATLFMKTYSNKKGKEEETVFGWSRKIGCFPFLPGSYSECQCNFYWNIKENG